MSQAEPLVTSDLHAFTSRSFVHPSVEAYEAQKAIATVKPTTHARLDLIPPVTTGITNLPEYAARLWNQFFSRRLSAILAPTEQLLPSPFPGHTVPGYREQDMRYRGWLLFDQFTNLLDFDKGAPSASNIIARQEPCLQYRPLPDEAADLWSWRYIEKPRLYFIESADEPEELKADPQFVIAQLNRHVCDLFNTGLGLEKVLASVHHMWGCSRVPEYMPQALKVVQSVLNIDALRQKQNALAVLFELEAFASYATYGNNINVFASGIFGHNWIELGDVPLASIRGTELCVTDRLLDEMVNLTQARFAPIVLNEFSTVADGNHRLTSCWIWNLLHAARTCQWSLESDEFQRIIARAADKCFGQSNLVSRHEALHHLGKFLQDPTAQARLNSLVRPALYKYDQIVNVPVTLLPEYLSGAVSKAAYDEGRSLERVHPHLYAFMADSSCAVLPPRASYHFTDSALLPWFLVHDRSSTAPSHNALCSESAARVRLRVRRAKRSQPNTVLTPIQHR